MAQVAEERKKLTDPAWLMLIFILLTALVSMAMQWTLFAKTSYVDDRVATVQKRVDERIDVLQTTENEHYIELLKLTNEIKVILQDKENRPDTRNERNKNETGARR